MKIYAVIGANFGDEGKGLVTNKLAEKLTNAIVVRHNGGAQAGHTVCKRFDKEAQMMYNIFIIIMNMGDVK